MFKKLSSVGLGTRIIGATVLLMLVVVGVNYAVFVSSYERDVMDSMVDKASSFSALAEETKNHTGKLAEAGAFDIEGMLAELKAQRAADPDFDYTESRIFGTIPVVAGWTAAENAAEKEGLEFRVSAFEARNPANEPTEDGDPFRYRMLKDLTAQHETGGSKVIERVNEETNALHYMRAITLTDDCMMCHGQPGGPNDPDGDGKDVLGFAMEGWSPGDMHGAYELVMPLAPVDASVASFVATGAMWTGPMVLGGGVIFFFLMQRMFSRPMHAIIDRVKDIAEGEGDLTKRLDAGSRDELGTLAGWFNKFMERIQSTIRDVADASNEVAAAATEIAASSEEMSQGMEQQNGQVAQISSAIEEMSASVGEVASKANEASASAAASGQSATQGGEIVSQTIEGMNAISVAVQEGTDSVKALGAKSDEIGQIVEVINDIAEQTNLLALNAAIEAARAGEHGRGFAVVADEVRKLADRTTKATDEIGTSIQAIQSETEQAVARMDGGMTRVGEGVKSAQLAGTSLGEIVESAKQVAGMVQTIAAATEQQGAAAGEISQNAENIAAVTRESAEGARQASEAASQLSERAETLKRLVGQFKTEA